MSAVVQGKVFFRLIKMVCPYWVAFVIAIVGNILHGVVDASFTYSLKPLLDRGFVARDASFIRYVPIILIGLFLVRGIASLMAVYGMTWVGRSVILQMRRRLFDHLLQMPARFYDSQSGGSLLSMIIYNVEQVAFACTEALTTIAQSGFMIISLLIVMFINSWRLSLIYIFVLPVVAIVVKFSSQRMRRLSTHAQAAMGLVTHVAEETIEGYQVVRTFGGQEYERNKFLKWLKTHRQREMKIAITNTLGSSIVQLVAAFALAYTVYLATSLHPKWMISAGSFISLITAMLALLKPMKDLSSVNTNIQKGLAGAQSIFSILDQAQEHDTGKIQLSRAEGDISYRNVFFTYGRADNVVLHNINLDIKPGQRIAFVGRSGSGKTTLVNLLMRFYDIGPGNILLDGRDVREYTLTSLRAQFALVSQQVMLFNDTVARNIAYGCLERVSHAEVEAAARQAHALEFIQRLPEGFATAIGDNGVLLSGGERQRIAIARALLKNAPILILDEATSALDFESERYISDALEKLMRNRTTLVIAHRLSTVEKADQIVMMDQGRIVEVGRHHDLLAKGGPYAKLYVRQFSEETNHDRSDK